MYIDNFGEILAIGFDIDGTLYKNSKLNIRVWPHVIRHARFFSCYSKTRKIMHSKGKVDDFTATQNQILADLMHISPEKAGELQNKYVYQGLTKYFKNIKPYKGAVELIKELKAAGFKIAILSDFPPEQKGDIWGLKPYCDVILGTAESGALKPAAEPFLKMAEELGVQTKNILYVGNSLHLDIGGAIGVGIRTAWISSRIKCRYSSDAAKADFSFWNYKQLSKRLLGNKK